MDPRNNSRMEALAAFNQRLLEQVVKPLAGDGAAPNTPEVLQSLAAGLAQNSERWLEIQKGYYEKQLELWNGFTSAKPDAPPPKIVEAEPGDRRFRAPEWQQPYFSFLAQSYLLNARWLTELVDAAQLEPQAKRKLA